MKKISIFLSLSLLALSANSASTNPQDNYEKLKQSIEKKYEKQIPKQWGEKVNGVKTQLNTNKKVIALTMNACGLANNVQDAQPNSLRIC